MGLIKGADKVGLYLKVRSLLFGTFFILPHIILFTPLASYTILRLISYTISNFIGIRIAMSTPLEQYSMPDIDSVTSLHPTETAKSLRRELTHVQTRDVNTPENARAFPEEYTVETETGLVKTETVREAKGTEYQGLDPVKVNKAIEKNKRELEGKGWWSKLKHKMKL
jgi:hypothetical protein